MEKETTYNGYTNRETFLVSLWLDNDEDMQILVQDLVRTYEGFALANALHGLVEVLCEKTLSKASIESDLLRCAIERADYKELADFYKAENYNEAERVAKSKKEMYEALAKEAEARSKKLKE